MYSFPKALVLASKQGLNLDGKVTGIGTARAGPMDAWPANDIALQGGMKIIKSLDDRPNREEMESLAENWRPYRGEGALLLWHVPGVVVKKQISRTYEFFAKLCW